MTNSQEPNNIDEKSTIEEIREGLATIYTYIENWIRPSKSQPLLLQILLLLLKLPVLLLLLLFSPVVLVIMLFLSMIAL